MWYPTGPAGATHEQCYGNGGRRCARHDCAEGVALLVMYIAKVKRMAQGFLANSPRIFREGKGERERQALLQGACRDSCVPGPHESGGPVANVCVTM